MAGLKGILIQIGQGKDHLREWPEDRWGGFGSCKKVRIPFPKPLH
jgi:hypothetical protein